MFSRIVSGILVFGLLAVFVLVGCSTAAKDGRLMKSEVIAESPPPPVEPAPVMVGVAAASPVYRQVLGYRNMRLGQKLVVAETYAGVEENTFKATVKDPLSTFSIDVDSASYSNARRYLNDGYLPPKDAVRIEEFINYFEYDYSQPKGDAPFAIHMEIAACPWQPKHRLMRVGVKGREVDLADRPDSNFVFLLDVSGSMSDDNKLPLLKTAMALLVNSLGDRDRVAIVVYAGASGLALDSTPCTERNKNDILKALDNLAADGSTHGSAGIMQAYEVAEEHFIKGGVNRVILATDGDFNVGTTSRNALEELIADKAKSGVYLTVLGFGMGNLQDATLETLADKGNGNYGYIDTISEARRLLVQQMAGTLITLGKDVKIQVEFNPAVVDSYRLVGYENRMLAAEDFNDDKKDAGEIGAGHTVTALYEIVPVGVRRDDSVDPLKYQENPVVTDPDPSGETATIKLRYKEPDGDESKLITVAVTDEGHDLKDASPAFVFAAAVAEFAMLLRDSEFKGEATYREVSGLAERGLGEDAYGHRREFMELVDTAEKLSRE